MAKRGVRTAMKSGTKVKDLQRKVKKPLGERRRNCIYEIKCGCEKKVYVGQSKARFEERKKQHQQNVKKTIDELRSGKEMDKQNAEIRMKGISGRLYYHATKECDKEIL